MTCRVLVALFALSPSLAAIAAAMPTGNGTQAANAFDGSWDLNAGSVTIFRFTINAAPTRPSAVWTRPEHFAGDGQTFSKVSGKALDLSASRIEGVDRDLELSFQESPRPSDVTVIRLHKIDPNHLSATYEGTGLEPFKLVRSSGSKAIGPWDSSAIYVRQRRTNPEMTAIFDADQADRRTPNINWSIVNSADEKRRRRTQQLLDSGALQSGNDYWHAAFIFQHGSTPADFLKAHLLAMIAIARGQPAATWIAAATLDRYLQSIGRPQVLGTQFTVRQGVPATQQPYDADIASDAMRRALGVPSLAEQEKQRQQYSKGPPQAPR